MKKSVVLGIVVSAVVVIVGVIIGYFVCNNYNEISVLIDTKKDEYNYDYCASVLINGKDISNELGVGEYVTCSYEVYNNLAIITVSNPDFNSLYVYNSKGNKLLTNDDISEDLFTHYWNFDNVNGKITFYGELTDEQGGVADIVQEITGKGLYELTCDELDYYKDKIVASETYEVKLLKNKISDVILTKKVNLENYETNKINFYQDKLLTSCQN